MRLLLLPALEKIKRNDIVVFNWPVDTVHYFFEPKGKPGVIKPIDRKSNYVKRCVGVPGDSLSIKDGFVFINNKKLILPERAKPQYSYAVALDGKTPIDFESLLKEMNVNLVDVLGFRDETKRDTLYFAALTEANAERLKNTPGITNVKRQISKGNENSIFPHINKWNQDNFGPIYIPEAGKTVALTNESLPFYKDIITTMKAIHCN